MCFDPQKILDPYLRWFGKYRNMTFAQKCGFWAFFVFFRLFLRISADFEGIFDTFTIDDMIMWSNGKLEFTLIYHLYDEVWPKIFNHFSQQDSVD